MISFSELNKLCINTANILFEINDGSCEHNLVFPFKKDNKKRISEQEARFIFANELEKNNFKYAIEVPTNKRYSGFSGGNIPKVHSNDNDGMSASIDLCIFDKIPDNNDVKGKINVEFKAHNVEQKHITKDFLKLYFEKGSGLFFHLLESVDNNTLNVGFNNDISKIKASNEKGILSKYCIAIDEIQNANNFPKEINQTEYILFFLCSLNPKFVMSKVFLKNSNFDFKNLEFSYEVPTRNEKYIIVHDCNGWSFYNYGQTFI